MGKSHDWSEKDFDWASLNAAVNYLHINCRRWARLGVWVKEKYGTLRVSCTCAYFTQFDFLHHIFYPGYVSYRWPRWFRQYVDWPVGTVLAKIGVVRAVQWYQHKVLKFFWKRASKKWPHISEEILAEYYWTFELKKDRGNG